MKAKLFSVCVVLIFGFVMVWVFSAPNPNQLDDLKGDAFGSLSVTAIRVEPTTMSNHVTAIGISKARWQLNVISPVAGKVKALLDEIEPGVKVAQNTLLSSIVDTSYRSELVTAESRVAQAELELARYQHEQYVVKHIAGQRKSNAFGNFEPHIKFAKAELAAAKVRVKYAKERLADTLISAPYNAIILEKYITPSQWVNEGDLLLKIASTDSIDINVELSEMVWQRLGRIDNNTAIEIKTPTGKVWQASVRYINPTLNKQTRQRSAVLQVAQPFSETEPLMPEQQVNVVFKGKDQTNVVKAASMVLTRDNKVWSVIDNKLILESIEIIEEQTDAVFFRYLESASTPRTLVLFPLSSMLIGQKVTVEALAAEDI